jgi:hypothetical protein
MFAKIKLDGNPWIVGPHFNVRDDGQLMLDLGNIDAADLRQLQGLPIADLYLSDKSNVTDVGPLADMPGLENVAVPALARNIETLRKLPKLKRLSFWMPTTFDFVELNRIYFSDIAPRQREQQGNPRSDTDLALRRVILFDITDRWFHAKPDTTAEEFWKEYPTLSWLPRLRDSAVKPSSISRQTGGTWSVEFNDKDFSDLSILQGMPISVLGLQGTSVTDLTPLRGMPLTDLQFQGDKVADLTPLKGMRLKVLFADNTKVTDLRPLQGMPLEFLAIDRTPVSDLSPLRGMPLTTLRLRNCQNITDLTPLADLKQLTGLVLPATFTDFDFLHTLPKLQRLSYDSTITDGGPDKSTDQFWAALATEMPWAAPLRKANIPYKLRRLSTDHSWALNLDNQPVSDLSILKGGNISQLSLIRTPVTDLSPLAGMKLTALSISGTKVADLWPIKAMSLQKLSISGTLVSDLKPLTGMPLNQLYMANCKQITDISPLAGMGDTLENLTLPPNAKNIEFLRKFPKLKRISFKYDTTAKAPSQTADEFWAEYDSKRAVAAATQPGGG